MGSSLHIFLYGVPFKGVTNKENVMKQFRNLPYFVTSLNAKYVIKNCYLEQTLLCLRKINTLVGTVSKDEDIVYSYVKA